MKNRNNVFWALGLLLAATFVGLAAPSSSLAGTPEQQPAAKEPTPGITVGAVKLFDERVLRAMLRNAEAALSQLQFSNRDSLATALGRIQGYSLEQSSQALQLSPVPTAGVTSTLTRGLPGQVTTDSTVTAPTGTTTTDSVVTTQPTGTAVQQVTQPSYNVTLPTQPGQTSAFSPQGTGGIAAQDLLAEQEALNYQVTNLRMLLQGAITDRVKQTVAGDETYIGPRHQAILGFQVSIAPEHSHKGKIAEVEVELKSAAKDADLTLVSLYPREKTYNVATIRKRSSSLGVGAVFQVLSVGYSGSRSRETLYYVKDTDTVALERPASPGGVKAAWQFRPTLGRQAVDPGTRQVFLVVSIPTYPTKEFAERNVGVKQQASATNPGAAQPSTAAAVPAQLTDAQLKALAERAKQMLKGDLIVRTRWVKFHRSSKTLGEPATETYTDTTRSYEIPTPDEADKLLGPYVKKIAYQELASGGLAVTLDGGNFGTDTRVLVGDVVLGPGPGGFALQSENRILFVAGQDLLRGDRAQVVGNYGEPQSLLTSEGQKTTTLKVDLFEAKVTPLDARTSSLWVDLRVAGGTPGSPGTPPAFPIGEFIVLVGDRIFGLPSSPISRTELSPIDGKRRFILELRVPTNLVADRFNLRVARPFFGDNWASEKTYFGSTEFSVTEMTSQLSRMDGKLFTIKGRNFREDITVTVGKDHEGKPIIWKSGEGRFTRIDSGLLTLFLTKAQLGGLDQIVLKQGDGAAARTVVVPLEPPPTPVAFAITEKVFVGDRGISVRAVGDDVPNIQRVLFEGVPLNVRPVAGALLIQLTPAMTEKPGRRQIDYEVRDKDNNVSIKSYRFEVLE